MIKNIRDEKGITMITLIVTVALLVIVTSIVATRSYTSVQLSNLTKLKNDIETLNDRVATYFVQNDSLPAYKVNNEIVTKTKSEVKAYTGEIDSKDGETYYVIDLEAIDNISLNYGDDYKVTNSSNKYVINVDTHIIYYLKGINYDGNKYYSIDANIGADEEEEKT